MSPIEDTLSVQASSIFKVGLGFDAAAAGYEEWGCFRGGG